MKTSLRKLQKFAAHKIDKKPQKKHQYLALDELAQATQDMNEMKECYDRLLAAAAATANSVYEFSESLKEMGDCLLEKTALNDDEDSGKVLLRMGKVQFELQKLADKYRTHIFQTVTTPSESLLNELHIVEEMKKRCDGKREIYEDLMKKQKEKGKSRSIKGESLTSHQLEAAHDEYDEEANVFVFRMKSLKQGQSRSLLTQGSRHYAAQLCFFKKALRSLEAVEPHVRLVAEQQHIDYQFSGLRDADVDIYEDVDGDDDDDESDSGGYYDTVDGSEIHDDIKMIGVNGQNVPEQASKMKTSMELDDTDTAHSTNPTSGAAKENLPSRRRNSFSFQKEVRPISKSAPLFPEKKLDSTEQLRKMRPSHSRKFTSYALPTPDETKSPTSAKLEKEVPQTREALFNLWQSSPLDQNKYEKRQTNDKLSGPVILATQSVLKESNNNKPTSQLPPPLRQNLSFKQSDPSVGSYAKKVKRQAFSGPLSVEPWPNNPSFSTSDLIVSSGCPPPISLSLLRAPLPRPISVPRLSSHSLPTFVSSPKISELHELPRPPAPLTARGPRATHSGPLSSKSHEMSPPHVSLASTAAVLPRPPPVLPRSHTIPAGGLQEVALDGIYSPRLAPVSLPDVQPSSPKS